MKKNNEQGFGRRGRALGLLVGLLAVMPAMADTAASLNRGRGQQFRQLGERINDAQQAGDLALAEDLARQRLALAEGGPSRQVGNAYRSLGAILRLRGRNGEAEAMLRKAQPLIEESNGRESFQAIRGLFNLAGTLLNQSRYADADAVLRDALARQLASRPQHPDIVQAYNLLAKTQTSMARFDEAEALLQKARRAVVAADPAEGSEGGDRYSGGYGVAYRRAQTMDLQATLDFQRGRAAEAEAHFREAVDAYLAILPDQHPDIVQARIMLGASLLQQGRGADAEAILMPLVPVAEQVLGPRHRATARAQYFLALAQARRGQATGVEEMFRRSLASLRNGGQLGQLAQVCRGYGRYLAGRKRPAEALPLYREALEAIDAQFARTRGLDEATRENFIARYGAYYTETLELLLRLHAAAPTEGYDREALAVVSRTQSRLFTEMLREADVGKMSGDSVFKQMKARQETARARLAELRRVRAEAGRDEAEGEAAAPAGDPFVASRIASRLARLNEDIAAQEKELAAADTALWDGYPPYMELTQPRPVTVDLLQKSLLKPGETLLTYYLLPKRVLIFVVERERFRLVEVARTRQEVAQLVAAARKPEEEAGGDLGQLARLDPAVLNQLYKIAFAPVEPLLKPGQRLLLIGDGPLHTLPMEMLVSRWGPEEQKAFAAARSAGPLLGEYATLSYLGQHYQFAYLPSLSALVSVRLYRKPAVRYGKELVSFADPVFERGATYSGATRRALEVLSRSAGAPSTISIPRLPETAEEAREIAAIVGGRSEVYLRERAQEHTAKTIDLRETRYLHFATHGLLGGEFLMVRDAIASEGGAGRARNLAVTAAPAAAPVAAADPLAELVAETPPAPATAERGQPALVLSLAGDLQGEDGLLTMSEVVENMDLNAQLVVLSACNTAGESASANSGEGFAGLTRAFMYAGAKGLLVSHWSVESRSTQELMTELFRRTRAGTDNLTALEGARGALRGSSLDAGRPVSRAHPYFWAPFVYVGD